MFGQWMRGSNGGRRLRVVVEIADVQGLVWSGRRAGRLPNPYVDVRVDNVSKPTAAHNSTSSCTIDKVMVFDDVPDEPETPIEVLVCHKAFFSRDLIGSYNTTVGDVMALPGRRTPKELLSPLTHPEAPSEPRGFIRLTIQVVRPGEQLDTVAEALKASTAGNVPRVLKLPELDFDTYVLTLNVHIAEAVGRQRVPPSPFLRVRAGSQLQSTQVVPSTRTPAWNEALKFAVSVPATSDRVTLEICDADEGLEPDSPTIGASVLSLQSLLRQPLQPTWVNLYSCPSRSRAGTLHALAAIFDLSSTPDDVEELSFEWEYVGRVLLSAVAVKHTGPITKLDRAVAGMVPTPMEANHVLWMDFYDIVGWNDVSNVQVEVSFGHWTHTVEPKSDVESGLFDEGGRVPSKTISLPIASSMVYDAFLRIYGRPKVEGVPERDAPRKLLASSRIAGPDLVRQKYAIPTWLELSRPAAATGQAESRVAGAPLSLLLSASLRRVSEQQQRPERPLITTNAYRAVVTVVQACNLPALPRSLPSAFVSACVGGVAGITRTVVRTLNPTWHEMLQFDCRIPNDPAFARDVQLRVMSGRTCLGEAKLSVDWLLSPEARQARWMLLQSARFERCESKLLASVCLLEPGSTPPTALPDLEYAAYDVQTFIIGCRLFSSVITGVRAAEDTSLRLEFGRQAREPSQRQWTADCGPSVNGARGNIDIRAPYDLQCYLPQSALQQNYLDIRVLAAGKEVGSVVDLGTAYAHLTPKQPGIQPKLARALSREFGTAHPLREASTESVDDLPDGFFASVSTKTNGGYAASGGSRWQRGFAGKVGTFVASATDKEKASRLELARQTEQFKALGDFQWHDEGAVDTLVSFGPDLDLGRPLESDLPLSQLPYDVIPIMGPARNSQVPGVPDCIGYIKVHLQVTPAVPEEEEEQAQIGRAKTVQQLDSHFRFFPKLKIRVHVLGVSGLLPPMGRSLSADESEWFLIVLNQKHPLSDGVHNIVDRGYTSKGMCPDFYRSFELDFTSPTDTFLCIAVACTGALWGGEVLAGHALIDIEDRWLHPGRPTVGTPIETAALKGGVEVAGRIRYQLELLTIEEAAARPMKPLEMPQPEPVEVRIALWQAKGLPLDGGAPSPYVVASFPTSSIETDQIPQETETYYRASDGLAVFNWRFVFRRTVPGDSTQLKLQAWSRNLLRAHQSLGETLVELSTDLDRVRSTKMGVELGRTWVRLTDPSGETGGFLELEISILPVDEADVSPVGLGRGEPNQMPFLPAVERGGEQASAMPSLGILGASDAVQGFFGTGKRVAIWIKTIFYLCLFILVISTVQMFKRMIFSW